MADKNNSNMPGQNAPGQAGTQSGKQSNQSSTSGGQVGQQAGSGSTGGQGYNKGNAPGQYQSGQYKNWDKAWQENLPEIDRQITDHYNKPGFQESSSTPSDVTGTVKNWVKNNPKFDQSTKSEFEQACATPQFQSQVDERIDYLRNQGKIPAKQGKAGGQSF